MNPITRPRRSDPAGTTPSKREPFNMAAHREQFGKTWGAEAKRASARLRKARV